MMHLLSEIGRNAEPDMSLRRGEAGLRGEMVVVEKRDTWSGSLTRRLKTCDFSISHHWISHTPYETSVAEKLAKRDMPERPGQRPAAPRTNPHERLHGVGQSSSETKHDPGQAAKHAKQVFWHA